MTEKEVVTPEWLYCPYSSPRQSLSRGPWYLKTKEEEKIWIPD